MAMFVHLTSEKNANQIARNGIRLRRSAASAGRVVFAMPVTRNYFVSNQWLRELKRAGQRTIIAVQFRIPDTQVVLVGHYGAEHRRMTAAEAVNLVSRTENAEGFEVLIPRRIDASEIQGVRHLKQVVGWRYFPGSHGRPPCGCEYCQRGQVNGRKVRAKYDASQRPSAKK
jgi:hypothetical protein